MPFLAPTYPVGVPWLAPWYNQPAIPQQPQIQPPPVDPAVHGSAPQGPVYGPPAPTTFTPPAFDGSGGMLAPPAQTQSPAPTSGYDVNAAMLSARNNVLGADRRSLDASGRVISAQRGTLPAQYGVLGARQGVINAQGQYGQAQRGFIGEQQGANAERETARQAILGARNNTADQAAVAQAKNFRENMDRNYQFFGVSAPEDVVNRDGSVLPPGTRDALLTQEQIVTEREGDAEDARKLRLDNARLAVAMIGTNVDEAQRMASQAGLTLDQAKMMVTQAQLDEDEAQLGGRYARLDEDVIKTPAFAGAERFTDPVTGKGEWLTPMVAELRRQEIRGLGTRPAETPKQETPASQRYSETSLGAFSDAELLKAVGQPNAPWSEQQITSELVSRGLTPEQARTKVQQARPQQGTTAATRYSPTPLGAFSDASLLNFIGTPNAPVSEPQVISELLARGYTPGQVGIMVAQEKLRQQPSTPTLTTNSKGEIVVKGGPKDDTPR